MHKMGTNMVQCLFSLFNYLHSKKNNGFLNHMHSAPLNFYYSFLCRLCCILGVDRGTAHQTSNEKYLLFFLASQVRENQASVPESLSLLTPLSRVMTSYSEQDSISPKNNTITLIKHTGNEYKGNNL